MYKFALRVIEHREIEKITHKLLQLIIIMKMMIIIMSKKTNPMKV